MGAFTEQEHAELMNELTSYKELNTKKQPNRGNQKCSFFKQALIKLLSPETANAGSKHARNQRQKKKRSKTSNVSEIEDVQSEEENGSQNSDAMDEVSQDEGALAAPSISISRPPTSQSMARIPTTSAGLELSPLVLSGPMLAPRPQTTISSTANNYRQHLSSPIHPPLARLHSSPNSNLGNSNSENSHPTSINSASNLFRSSTIGVSTANSQPHGQSMNFNSGSMSTSSSASSSASPAQRHSTTLLDSLASLAASTPPIHNPGVASCQHTQGSLASLLPLLHSLLALPNSVEFHRQTLINALGPVENQFNNALTNARAGNWPVAEQLFETAVSCGSAKSAYALYLIYRDGRPGISPNSSASSYYLQKASSLGYRGPRL